MRPWRFDFRVVRDAGVAQHTQLARALVHEIQRGRLLPGATLPGSRTLATQLGVNRKVVVAALDELVVQGWLETRRGSGTRVAASLPRSAIADVELPSSPRRATHVESDGGLAITDGLPDPRLAPQAELGRAYARALRFAARSAAGYADPAGDAGLRAVLAAFVNQARGLSTTASDVFVTRGSQGALSLYALAMLRPGDVVIAESPGYAPAWRAFELAGATVVHVPVDAGGMRTDVLEKLARKHAGKLKAVYATPHHQYPTSVALLPERRMALLALAERFDFQILEDDYDYEYHFDGQPLLPLHATGAVGRVVYIASLSKVLAPAIRLGYVIGCPRTIARLKETREQLDRQGDLVLERAIAELVEDGVLQRHVRRARRAYAERRDALLERLSASSALAEYFEYEVPAGGLALWLRVRPGSIDGLVARAEARGLRIQPGARHVPRGRLDAFRFGFASHTPAELARICATLERCVSARPA